MNTSPSRLRLKILSRETPSRPASAFSFSTLRARYGLTHGIPPDFHGAVHLFMPPYVIESVSSLSGHAIAYRWRSVPRVRRNSTSSPQGSSSNGSCLCITMDQLMCTSLFLRQTVGVGKMVGSQRYTLL